MTLRDLEDLQRAGGEDGPAGRRRELAVVARRVRQREAPWLVDLLVVGRTARDHPRDPLPDRGVVGAERRPGDVVVLAERRDRERADDVDLRAELVGGRLERS